MVDFLQCPLYSLAAEEKKIWNDNCIHRVDRVLGFFSSRLNWGSPPPHEQAKAYKNIATISYSELLINSKDIKILYLHHKSLAIWRAIPLSSVADPWHFSVDPDPSIFIIDLQDANKKLIFFKSVFLQNTFWRYFYIIFPR